MRVKWGIGLPGPFFLTGGGGRSSSRGSALVALAKLLAVCFWVALVVAAIEIAVVLVLALIAAGVVGFVVYGVVWAVRKKKRDNYDINNWAASQARYRDQRGRYQPWP